MENSNTTLVLELALDKLVKSDISGALQMLEEAKLNGLLPIELINLQADCYYLLGDFFQAKKCWEQVLELEAQNKLAFHKLELFSSPSFQFWLKRYYEAIKEIENKNFLNAQKILLALLAEQDNFVSLYQLLGLTYLALNDEKNAIRVWRTGLKIDISNPELIRYINSPKKSVKKARSATKEQTPVNNSSKNLKLYIASGFFCLLLLLQMGYSLDQGKGYQTTINNLQNKISILSKELNSTGEAVLAMADAEDLVAEGDIIVDTDIIEEVKEEVKEEGEYYQIGYQAYLAKDYNTAINNLSEVVAISSKTYINREGLYYLALSYYVSRDYENAKDYYYKYLEEFPDTNYTDESLYYLAGVYYYTNDLISAKSMLDELDAYDPNSGYKSTELYLKIRNS
ncbi:MAG: tetratricopeptide repeat protein [Syntrophomonadaceae bacterium]|nr:tetratricopeptide repeat protein [Syntrophomonadaceae bacterium]